MAAAIATTVRSGRVSRTRRSLWRSRWALMFVSPWIILFGVFSLWPYGFGLWLSLLDWQGARAPEFVGLGNYLRVMGDARFWGSMGNIAVLFLLYVPAMTALSVAMGLVLNDRRIPARGFWLLIMILPNVTSMVAIAYTFQLMFDTNSGIINGALGLVGIAPVPWLGDTAMARVTIAIMLTWASFGFNALIVLAGLQSISPEITEAAKVDGASDVRAFFAITLPLLRPVITFIVIVSLIGMISIFTEPYVMTEGGPVNATETPAIRIFRIMFEQVRYGYGAAMGIVAMAVVLVIAVVQFRFARGGRIDA